MVYRRKYNVSLCNIFNEEILNVLVFNSFYIIWFFFVNLWCYFFIFLVCVFKSVKCLVFKIKVVFMLKEEWVLNYDIIKGIIFNIYLNIWFFYYGC